MSIVERALQKAQARAKSDATVEPGPQGEAAHPAVAPVDARAVEPAPAPSDPGAMRPADTATDLLRSLTARDLKPLVQIDTDRLRADGRMPSVDMARQVDEEMRRIKWPLLAAVTSAPGVTAARNAVIMVTSALPGEGKTFMSLNLALSIVRDREMRVILVDGDVARPGLTPALGLEGRLGLNDVLDNRDMDVSDVTYQTDIEGLFFVPSGTWHEHSPEFFASSRMPQVTDALCHRAGRGVVIFDSAPLLSTNDSQVATRMAGQVVVVVRAEETEQQAVTDAIALIDKGASVSAVLNCCVPSAMARYYGQYYYGYGYGNKAYGPNDASRE